MDSFTHFGFQLASLHIEDGSANLSILVFFWLWLVESCLNNYYLGFYRPSIVGIRSLHLLSQPIRSQVHMVILVFE